MAHLQFYAAAAAAAAGACVRATHGGRILTHGIRVTILSKPMPFSWRYNSRSKWQNRL
jgi:hypothetical protein